MIHVEGMIRQSYPHFYKKAPSLVLNPGINILKRLFHEKEVNTFISEHNRLSGLDFIERILEHLNISYRLNHQQIENIPAIGKAIVVANHPLGAADALALIHIISKARQDKGIKIVANQMLSHIPQLSSLLIPVDNIHGKLTRHSLLEIDRALQNEEIVIFFPAGEVSRASFNGIKDSYWKNGFIKIAQRTSTPVLPIHIDARNSFLFYFLSFIYKPFSSFLLGHELMRSKKTLGFNIGEIIPISSFENTQFHPKHYARLFRKHLYRLAHDRKTILTTEQSISHPLDRQSLLLELKKAERLGNTTDAKVIYLVDPQESPSLLKEIGRLREYTFRKVGEGTGTKRDTDKYDDYYMHLLVWDEDALEIVGAYRLGECSWIMSWLGKEGLYMNSLCKIDDSLDDKLEFAIELGRSFVQPKYWGSRALDYLWQGIGAYLSHNPHIKYMYGPVSISNSYPNAAKDILVYFYTKYFQPSSSEYSSQKSFQAKHPYIISKNTQTEFDTLFNGQDYTQAFRTLKSFLKGFGIAVPTLYKQYADLCEEEGVSFFDFGVDASFNNSIDGYIMVDLSKLKDEKRARYLLQK